ncbi:MAG: phosphomannomutase/phosphoglucomutase [Candidatus Heimdallarchaeota archaeon]|nr:phosphomannomutase/phosphoglucomutase [Candidatus Heimdallarchaeota archaeon]MCK4876891.1 phosphomannomutase/phosphoglucomutase [Candidatus Heimdallarchaeota archaeon]
MTSKISPHIFRAYDIRGLYKKDLTPDIMYKIGLSVGTYVNRILEGESVVVGNDIRQSSIPLAYSFISGVLASGINVTYVGTTAFGQTLFAGWELGGDTIAFITASHLPPEWNGIKFYHKEGVGYSEEELMEIRDLAIQNDYDFKEWGEVGKTKDHDITTEYKDFFNQRIKFKKEIKVAVDCGGGSTTLSVPDVFSSLGLTTFCVFCEPDPTFSGRPSDPKPKNLSRLVKEVLTNDCDFGVAFDGDGDRAVIVDNKGKILSADETGIIIGKYGLAQKSGTIIVNVECSKAVKEQLEPLGFNVKQIPVGHTFLTIEAKIENSPLGIESSGHIIIPEFFLFDDAIVTPLKIVEILDNQDEKLSDLVNKIPTYPILKEEILCEDEIKFEVVDELKTKLSEEYSNINLLDGVRVNLEEGWILIRPSNTSPLIRMTIEADNDEIISKFKTIFREKVQKIIEKMKE